MRNYNANTNNFVECINSMTLKKWHDHTNLVVDIKEKSAMTYEDLCMGFGDIRNDVENHLGHFENLEIRIR